MFASWGRTVHRYRVLVLIVCVLMLPLSVVLMRFGGQFSTGQPTSDPTEASRAFQLIAKELPAARPSFSIILSSARWRVTDPRFRSAVQQALRPLQHNSDVADVQTAYLAHGLDPQLVARDGRRMLITITLVDHLRDYQQVYWHAYKQVHPGSLALLPVGNLPLNYDFNAIAESDLERAEVVSLPVALLLLVLVFGTIAASGLPLGVGVLAVIGGLAGTLLLARSVDVSVYSQQVVTMIGLGVAIDYSLFVTSRFREEVTRLPVPEALARTMETAGRAILFSGLTVAIGLLGMTFFHFGDLGSLGMAGTIVVALSVIYGLTFLPAVLSLLGTRVNAVRIPFVHPETAVADHGFWFRMSRTVMARPWAVLLPTAVLLLIVGIPVLQLRLAYADYTTLPRSSISRQGLELLTSQFPGGKATDVTVVLNWPAASPLTRAHIAAIDRLSRWLQTVPHVTRVDSLTTAEPGRSLDAVEALVERPRTSLPSNVRQALTQYTGAHIAVIHAFTPLRGSSAGARAIVNRIRDTHPAMAAQLLVTGQTAWDIDGIKQLLRDAPFAVGFIMLATFVVLFLLLGSILLPLKAILMNFLSAAAAFGAMVWIFQQGHGSGLLAFTPNPIETSTPVIVFCILFGLSMDYEVMLLSRVKEEYDRSGDNAASVAHGLARTGKLITGAAAIMACVFFAFVLAQTGVIKAIGFGLGFAVALDAAVIRTLLVPSAMRLLGHWNWWAPGLLERLHQRLGLAERQDVHQRGLAPAEAGQ